MKDKWRRKIKQGRKAETISEARCEPKRPHQENYDDYSRHPTWPQVTSTSAQQEDWRNLSDTPKQHGSKAAMTEGSDTVTGCKEPNLGRAKCRLETTLLGRRWWGTRHLKVPPWHLTASQALRREHTEAAPFGHTSKAARSGSFVLMHSPKPEAWSSKATTGVGDDPMMTTKASTTAWGRGGGGWRDNKVGL
jgi:hypothetical protein